MTKARYVCFAWSCIQCGKFGSSVTNGISRERDECLVLSQHIRVQVEKRLAVLSNQCDGGVFTSAWVCWT